MFRQASLKVCVELVCLGLKGAQNVSNQAKPLVKKSGIPPNIIAYPELTTTWPWKVWVRD